MKNKLILIAVLLCIILSGLSLRSNIVLNGQINSIMNLDKPVVKDTKGKMYPVIPALVNAVNGLEARLAKLEASPTPMPAPSPTAKK